MSEAVSVEALKEHFPPQNLEPYGPVLIIPNRMFKRGWELELEAQGHRVFATSYNGESSFLVRLDKGEPRNVESKHEKAPTPLANSSKAKDWWKRWTSEEIQRLQEMLKQGLGVDRIAKELERTEHSVQRKIQRLQLKAGPKPATTQATAISRDVSPILNTDENVVKELLEASLQLYPRYRHACQILLSEATTKIMNQEKSHVP